MIPGNKICGFRNVVDEVLRSSLHPFFFWQLNKQRCRLWQSIKLRCRFQGPWGVRLFWHTAHDTISSNRKTRFKLEVKHVWHVKYTFMVWTTWENLNRREFHTGMILDFVSRLHVCMFFCRPMTNMTTPSLIDENYACAICSSHR